MGLHVFQFTNILVVGLTTDDKFHYLNSEDELNKILQKCLCLVTTRFIPYDLGLVVVAIWQ